AKLLKVLKVACGKSGKRGKMMMRHIEPAFKQLQTSIRGKANKHTRRGKQVVSLPRVLKR
ncbi:MAG: hypothetical protein J6Y04_09720, partial [Bacteroidaceae bacterium]|nr:hypothetical protein [Bacteroidaceae bacterium]